MALKKILMCLLDGTVSNCLLKFANYTGQQNVNVEFLSSSTSGQKTAAVKDSPAEDILISY